MTDERGHQHVDRITKRSDEATMAATLMVVHIPQSSTAIPAHVLKNMDEKTGLKSIEFETLHCRLADCVCKLAGHLRKKGGPK